MNRPPPIFRASLVAGFVLAIAFGSFVDNLLWFFVGALVVKRLMAEHKRAESLSRQLAAFIAAGLQISPEEPIDEEAARVMRVDGKLRDRCLALEKQNVQLAEELKRVRADYGNATRMLAAEARIIN